MYRSTIASGTLPADPTLVEPEIVDDKATSCDLYDFIMSSPLSALALIEDSLGILADRQNQYGSHLGTTLSTMLTDHRQPLMEVVHNTLRRLDLTRDHIDQYDGGV